MRCRAMTTFHAVALVVFVLPMPLAAARDEPAAAARSAVSSAQLYDRWPFDAEEASRRQAETAKALGVTKQVDVDLGDGIPLQMVTIPAGKFMMGSPDTETIDLPKPGTHRTNESPVHEVAITRPFFIATFKVTQEQYQDVMGANPSKFVGNHQPVDSVTWEDAVLFCQRASAKAKRTIHLPTEAEWEYAARSGTATRYSFGDDETKIGEYAWFHDNAKGQTHPVGEKLPNAWGLFDVHGLLWEYTSDFYSDSYANSTSRDPIGPASGTAHSTRGGTYGSRPPFLRSAIRIESPAAHASKDILSHFGFRVVMDAGGAP